MRTTAAPYIVTNTTIADNYAFSGGGIFNFTGTVTVLESTLGTVTGEYRRRREERQRHPDCDQ